MFMPCLYFRALLSGLTHRPVFQHGLPLRRDEAGLTKHAEVTSSPQRERREREARGGERAGKIERGVERGKRRWEKKTAGDLLEHTGAITRERETLPFPPASIITAVGSTLTKSPANASPLWDRTRRTTHSYHTHT